MIMIINAGHHRRLPSYWSRGRTALLLFHEQERVVGVSS